MLQGANGTIPGHCGEANEARTGAAADGTGRIGVTLPMVLVRAGTAVTAAGEERVGAGSGGHGAGLNVPMVAAVDRSD